MYGDLSTFFVTVNVQKTVDRQLQLFWKWAAFALSFEKSQQRLL